MLVFCSIHTNLIQLQNLIFSTYFRQKFLGCLAVRAITLAEYHGGIAVDQRLGFCLCGGHGCGSGRGGAREERAEEINLVGISGGLST